MYTICSLFWRNGQFPKVNASTGYCSFHIVSLALFFCLICFSNHAASTTKKEHLLTILHGSKAELPPPSTPGLMKHSLSFAPNQHCSCCQYISCTVGMTCQMIVVSIPHLLAFIPFIYSLDFLQSAQEIVRDSPFYPHKNNVRQVSLRVWQIATWSPR